MSLRIHLLYVAVEEVSGHCKLQTFLTALSKCAAVAVFSGTVNASLGLPTSLLIRMESFLVQQRTHEFPRHGHAGLEILYLRSIGRVAKW